MLLTQRHSNADTACYVAAVCVMCEHSNVGKLFQSRDRMKQTCPMAILHHASLTLANFRVNALYGFCLLEHEIPFALFVCELVFWLVSWLFFSLPSISISYGSSVQQNIGKKKCANMKLRVQRISYAFVTLMSLGLAWFLRRHSKSWADTCTLFQTLWVSYFCTEMGELSMNYPAYFSPLCIP